MMFGGNRLTLREDTHVAVRRDEERFVEAWEKGD